MFVIQTVLIIQHEQTKMKVGGKKYFMTPT